MSATVAVFDRNIQAYARNNSSEDDRVQSELSLLGLVKSRPQMLDVELVRKADFNGALNAACIYSGDDDQTIAKKINTSQGYFSRALSGVWKAWAVRFVAFRFATNSLVPLQWLADRCECDVVPRVSRDAYIRGLEAQLAAAKGSA